MLAEAWFKKARLARAFLGFLMVLTSLLGTVAQVLAASYDIPIKVTTTGDKTRRDSVQVRVLNFTRGVEVGPVTPTTVDLSNTNGTATVSVLTTDITNTEVLKFFVTGIRNSSTGSPFGGSTDLVFDTGASHTVALPGPPPTVLLADPSGEIQKLTGTLFDASGTQVPATKLQVSIIHSQSTA
ncbi:MAG: hypothetical protein HY303_01590, partial [Candidatus Wallbacteria bacterium]|nr:hypothetical protein [Candidatus Wallbacteria bacterium]